MPKESIKNLLKQNANPEITNGIHFRKPHRSDSAAKVPINAQRNAERYVPPAAKQIALVEEVRESPS